MGLIFEIGKGTSYCKSVNNVLFGSFNTLNYWHAFCYLNGGGMIIMNIRTRCICSGCGRDINFLKSSVIDRNIKGIKGHYLLGEKSFCVDCWDMMQKKVARNYQTFEKTKSFSGRDE